MTPIPLSLETGDDEVDNDKLIVEESKSSSPHTSGTCSSKPQFSMNPDREDLIGSQMDLSQDEEEECVVIVSKCFSHSAFECSINDESVCNGIDDDAEFGDDEDKSNFDDVEDEDEDDDAGVEDEEEEDDDEELPEGPFFPFLRCLSSSAGCSLALNTDSQDDSAKCGYLTCTACLPVKISANR